MKFHKFTFISSSHTDKERFNSRGQHQWKFIGAKEEKSSSIGLALLLFWNTNMAAATSWENAQQTNSQSDQLPVSLLAQLVELCSGITEVCRIESRPFKPEHPRDLPYLTARIWYFKAKWARDARCRKWQSGLRDWAKVSVVITGSRNPCVDFEAQNVTNNNPLKNR